MQHYKSTNGRIIHRGGSGKFRKTTMEDMGIYDANKTGITFICNVCEKEFTPIVLSGKCCGVDNKRKKEVVPGNEAKAINATKTQ